MFAAFSASSTVAEQRRRRSCAFADETWTAGTSGKKLGSVYSMPITSATAMTMFQSG